MWTLDGLARLDTLARRYHCRPSQLTAEGDPYRAYCLDEACALVGMQREADALTDAREQPGEVVVENGIPILRGSIPFMKE